MSLKVLENPEIRKLISPLSVDTYHRMSELGFISQKTELIEGVVINKMTKSPDHSYYSGLFFEILRIIKPANFIVMTEKPISLLKSEPEPDIMIVPGTLKDYQKKNPTTAILIIEITNTSMSNDREKIPIYAEAGIENYWIVNIPKKQIETYKSPNADDYSVKITYQKEEIISIFDNQINLKDIFE